MDGGHGCGGRGGAIAGERISSWAPSRLQQRSATGQHFASRCQDKPVNECEKHPVEEKGGGG